MKVKFVKTGKVAEFNDSYGARLIEQGRAVRMPDKKLHMNDPEEAPEEVPEKTETKKGRKG